MSDGVKLVWVDCSGSFGVVRRGTGDLESRKTERTRASDRSKHVDPHGWLVLGLQRDLSVFCLCGSTHKGKQMAAVGNNVCVC